MGQGQLPEVVCQPYCRERSKSKFTHDFVSFHVDISDTYRVKFIAIGIHIFFLPVIEGGAAETELRSATGESGLVRIGGFVW